MNQLIKKHLLKALAFGIIIALYSLTTLPALSDKEKTRLQNEFSFTQSKLYEPAGVQPKFIRNVHPQYKHIDAWISSVGAAVTMTDIDNNGLCNDIIHVDPRFDKVLISPANGTPAAYQPFELYPHSLPYDSLTTAPMGTLVYDFNNDGRTDILVYYWGRTPIIFYQQENGFSEEELNTVAERWFSNAATLADFDGDGHIDILITNYFPDGSKVLDTKANDKDQVMQHSMSRAYNGGTDHFFLWTKTTGNGMAYKEDSGWQAGIENAKGWTLAVGAADIDGDMLPEIYFANDFGPDKLLYNLSTPGHLHFKELKGVRHFTDIRSGVLGKDSYKGMGVAFGDMNNDGLLDIYVSNITEEFALEESHFAFINTGDFKNMKNGIAPFENRSEELGLSRTAWSWDCKLADFNNDGINEAIQATGFVKGNSNGWAKLQELAIGNDELLSKPEAWPDFRMGIDLSGNKHNPFFVQNNAGHYFDMAPFIGIDQPAVSRGIAISDVNHDGKLDFIVANQWDASVQYTNTYKGTNAFLGLRIMQPVTEKVAKILIDTSAGMRVKFAIGAKATLQLENGKVIPEFVDGGNGHSGKNSNEVFFGLPGKDTRNAKVWVTLTWRMENGLVQQQKIQLQPGWHTIILPG